MKSKREETLVKCHEQRNELSNGLALNLLTFL